MSCFSDRFLSRSLIPDPRFALPGTAPQYLPDRDFRTEHIKLEFSFDIPKKTVLGKATITAKLLTSTDRLIFDAVGMQILSVLGKSGNAYPFDHDGERVTIRLPRMMSSGDGLEVTFRYRVANPPLGIYFVGPSKERPRKPVQIWTHSESEEARYWYPCHDAPHEKFTSEMLLTVPKDFTAISNGALHAVTDASGGNRVFHWKMRHPHAPYLVSFAVGRFAEVKESWDGIPISYYCEPGREAEAKRGFGSTPAVMEFFSTKIGVRYPYEKYAQVAVADFIFGGMEHTTATTQTDVALVDEKAAQDTDFHELLTAHELAHQWFGDLVTCRSWQHAWLNESFATYFEMLSVEHAKGHDAFFFDLADNAKTYFAEDRDRYRRPIVTNLYQEPSDIFDRHLYEKGALVLHMLRAQLGDAAWWRVIQQYVETHKHRTVTTEDLIATIEETTGRSMQQFFDQWVYGAGHPELRATYYWDDKAKEAVIRVAQIQRADDQTPLFTFPLTIDIVKKDGIQHARETFEGKQKQFRYKLAGPPLDVRIDPEFSLLKKLDFIKPKAMWFFQLEHDRHILGRIAAVQEVARIGTREAVTALTQQFGRERFWGGQAEIATALGTIHTEDAMHALEKLSSTPNPRARRYVAAALGEFKTEAAAPVLKKLLADRSSYFVPATAARSLGRIQYSGALPALKKMLTVTSWNDIIKAGVLEGLASLQTDDAIQLLKEHSKPGYHERSRMNAIRLLGNVGKGRSDVVETLLSATTDAHTLVQLTAVVALGELGDERAISRLEELSKGRRDGRVKRQAQEAIRKIMPWLETDLESAELKERYEKLKQQTEQKGSAKKK